MPISSALPFDDIRALLRQMPPASQECVAQVRARNSELAKPVGALGRVEEIAEWLAAWQGRSQPRIDRPTVVVFAANHGVLARGVAQTPAAQTRQMLEMFAAGGGAINQVCASFGLGFKVFDLALDIPTADIAQEAALDEKAAAATIAFGMEAISGGVDLLCLGDLGVGNTIIAAAIFAALYGGDAREWLPDNASGGLDRNRAIETIEAALDLHRAHLGDPLEVMRRLGGREICAIAGAIVAARMERVPVILDGYVVTAAAALLHAVDGTALDHCLAGHVAAGREHRAALSRLGKQPLLDLGIEIGEGFGAAMAAGVVKAALACHADMATRTLAGVAF
jgi:nicotinate-nucleotide--dimethylbenzimidazole phosphoribosyltransferase